MQVGEIHCNAFGNVQLGTIPAVVAAIAAADKLKKPLLSQSFNPL